VSFVHVPDRSAMREGYFPYSVWTVGLSFDHLVNTLRLLVIFARIPPGPY
jgi:hypothetical protein